LNGVQNRVPPVQDEIVKTAENARAAGKWRVLPTGLGLSGGRCGIGDIMGSRKLNVTNDFPGCGISNFDNFSLSDREL
jgi:hypothetical protein